MPDSAITVSDLPRLVMEVRPGTLEQFTEKISVDPETGCWRWRWLPGRAQVHRGRFQLNGTHEAAHTASYRMFSGPIPAGYDVDHVWKLGCRFGDCVLPRHLEAVPPIENARRATQVHHELAVPPVLPAGPLIDYRSPVPAYVQIANWVIGLIEQEKLRPAQPVPSESEIQTIFRVGRHTARHATEYLRDQGWIETVPHRRSYVVERDRSPASVPE